MRTNKTHALFAITVALLLLSACSINVQKESNGREKEVDINSPFGGIHVSKQADVADVGLPVYPGARAKERSEDSSDKSANVKISGFGYGIKVVALEYESADSPAKVIAFYKDQLKRYGNVLECHTSRPIVTDRSFGPHGTWDGSKELNCAGEHGNTVELKVGRQDEQHIVAIDPDGKGADFSLVYVRTHGKDSDI
jgi:hypothetical protein